MVGPIPVIRSRAVSEAEGFKVYKPIDVQRLLGVSRRVYYRLVETGLLPYTRLSPGGDRIHLEEHLSCYRDYLLAHTRGGEKVRDARGDKADG